MATKPGKNWHWLLIFGGVIFVTIFWNWFIYLSIINDPSKILIILGNTLIFLLFFGTQGIYLLNKKRVESKLNSQLEHYRQELTRSEITLQVLVENTRSGIIMFEQPENKIIYANQQIKSIFSINKFEDIFSVLPSDYLENALHYLNEQNEGDSYINDLQWTDRQGKKVDYLGACSLLQMNKKSVLVLAINDITENNKSVERYQKRASELAALYAMSRSLSAEQDLNALLEEVVDYATTLLSCSNAMILLYDASLESLELKVARGFTAKIGYKASLKQGIVGLVAQSLTSKIVDDYSKIQNSLPGLEKLKIRSVLSVPMVYGGELIGVVELFEVAPSTRVFSKEEARLLDMFAAQAASVVHNTWQLEKTNRHMAELEAVAQVSSILRSTQTIQEMLPSIVDDLLGILKTDTIQICLYNTAQTRVTASIARGWLAKVEKEIGRPEGLVKKVLQTGSQLEIKDFTNDLEIPLEIREKIPPFYSGAIFPLPAAKEISGILIFAFVHPRELTQNDYHIIKTITEIAGGAIQRAYLHERAEQQLKRISTLYSIDTVIRTSLDLNMTLKVMLDQVTTQLGVNAADILLFHPDTQTLNFGAGLRFHSPQLEKMSLQIGQDFAGKAIQEGRTIIVPDLSICDEEYTRSRILYQQGFVSCICVPLISKGEEIGVLEVFHRTLLSPDMDWLEFLEAMSAQTAIALDNARLVAGLQRTNLELTTAYDSTIEGWVRALDMRDEETEGHSQRVSEMTLRLARMVGFSENKLTHIRRGALLHDIGKIAVPDNILRKPGPLTPEEWQVMRRHPKDAYDMLSGIPFLQPTIEIPYCHHEKWDGSGYPRGLRGESIPLEARVFAVVDVWDALISDRPYRRAWSREKALEHIQSQSGIHFDPKIIDVFLRFVKNNGKGNIYI